MGIGRKSAWELARLDGVAQADLVRDREVAPQELIEAAIVRIEAANEDINAVVHKRFEQALADAERLSRHPSGPFAGVPFLLKDDGCAQAGVPQTKGNVALKSVGNTPPADSPLGRRFRESGLVTVGVTNMPEFGQLADTQPLAFGPTRNPWALDRSVGGSSGGAAAAVAAGLVPMAQASDGGGSIRIPAAACGVVGLKPSRGRMPRVIGAIDDIWSCPLVVSRSVRDTAAVLDAVNGALPGDLYGLPKPGASYRELLSQAPRRLRVGLLTTGPSGVPVSDECVRAVEQTGALLEAAGHHVELKYPSALLEEVPDWVNGVGLRHNGIAMIAHLESLLGRPVAKADVEPYTWRRYEGVQPPSATSVLAFFSWHLRRAARLLEWWDQGFDLLVTPVLNDVPEKLVDLAALSPAEARATERRQVTFLEPFNGSGQPAISLPVHWTEEGLPVGVQIAAAKGEDLLLLQVAAQIEEAVRWYSRECGVMARHPA